MPALSDLQRESSEAMYHLLQVHQCISSHFCILEVMPNTLAAISLPGNTDIASCQPLLVFEITIRYFFLQNTGHC